MLEVADILKALMGKPVPLALVPLESQALVPLPADAVRVLEVAAACARRGVAGTMATVLRRQGSAPATPGQKIYAALDQTCVGTVGGGAIEREILRDLALMLFGSGEGRGEKGHRLAHHTKVFKLGAELGMCCGGSVEVLLEPIEAMTPLLIVGGGHVATAVAPLLARIGFAVTVVDARDEWGAGGEAVAGVTRVMGDFDDIGRAFPRNTAILVMTHDHALDQRVIEWALRQNFAYVGGVGSRAKAQRTRDRLEAKGFSEEKRASIRMPIGLGIGARLPEEIAVSIAAEMVAWRRSELLRKSKEEA